MVRPILEYGNVVWSPHLKRQSSAIERVQRRATKLVPYLKDCAYEERLRLLQLPSLKYRRYRGDLIQTFKLWNKDDDLEMNDFYSINNSCTRNSGIKFYINSCSTNVKKFSFSHRTTKYWNTLLLGRNNNTELRALI